MKTRKEKNKLYIDGIKREFAHDIDTVLEFSDYCVIILMSDVVPDNNVIAVGYNGDIVWNISEIVKFGYPEAYITISKESEDTFSAVTYSGVKFVIDVLRNQIVDKKITK